MDPAVELGAGHGSDLGGDLFLVGVDHQGEGKDPAAVAQGDGEIEERGRGEEDGIGQGGAFEIAAHGLFVVEREAEELYFFFRPRLARGGEQRQLGAAGRTPRGPEIDDAHALAPVGGDAPGGSVGLLQLGIDEAGERRMRRRVALGAGEPQERAAQTQGSEGGEQPPAP